jgi:hypothetical protein
MPSGERRFPFGHVLNAAVWQFEYRIHQLGVMGFGSGFSHVRCSLRSQLSNSLHFRSGPTGRLFHGGNHELHPRFPGSGTSQIQQQPVIVGLVLNDVAAQVKDRVVATGSRE